MGIIANKLLALNSAKHAIRSIINERGGRLKPDDPLSVYPDAIEEITNFSEGEILSRHRVIFIDWDGTVLSDTYIKDGAAVVPPAVPQHEHLTFVKWTHTQQDMASVKSPLCIGARYTVEDDALFLYVEDSASINVSLKNNASTATYEIDWGDGNTQSVNFPGNSSTSVSHNYDSAFTGWIKIPKVNGYTLRFNSISTGKIKKVLAGGIYKNAVYETFSASIPTCAAYVENVPKGCYYLNAKGVVCDFIVQGYTSSWSGYGFSFVATDPHASVPNDLKNYYWGSTLLSYRSVPMLIIPEEFTRSPYNPTIDVRNVKSIVVTNYALAKNLNNYSFVFFRGESISAALTVARFDCEDGLKVLSTLTIYAYSFSTFEDFCRVMRKLGAVATTVSIKVRGCDSAQLQAVADILTPKGYTVANY